MSSLYFTGIAPAATDALSKIQKAFITSGARLSIFFSLAKFSLLYMCVFVCLSSDWISFAPLRSRGIRQRLRWCRRFWRCYGPLAVPPDLAGERLEPGRRARQTPFV